MRWQMLAKVQICAREMCIYALQIHALHVELRIIEMLKCSSKSYKYKLLDS